jgi:predicted ArsR family transcriptional regulator
LFYKACLWKNTGTLDLPAPTDPEDVLSQPTRARLFVLLSQLGRPAGTAELAEQLELHPNGIRIHLERLEQAGLIERARGRQPRGRPPDAWTIAPDAQPAGQPPRAYHDLGRWLARALAARPGGLRNIERTGREIGREIGPHQPGPPADALRASLASLGFQPLITEQQDDRLTVCLRNCPYRDAVHENQPAICTLHKGITCGLLDTLEPRAKLTAFIPHDPDEAGCVIELRGLPELTASR